LPQVVKLIVHKVSTAKVINADEDIGWLIVAQKTIRDGLYTVRKKKGYTELGEIFTGI